MAAVFLIYAFNFIQQLQIRYDLKLLRGLGLFSGSNCECAQKPEAYNHAYRFYHRDFFLLTSGVEFSFLTGT